jgi:hypothetical protein
MLRIVLFGAFVAQSLTSLAMAQDAPNRSPYDPNVEDLTARPPLASPDEPPMRGIHWTREFEGGRVHAGNKGEGKTPLMTYHGGKILTTTNTQAIFWGTSWPSDTSDKGTGIDSFYSGFNNSNYAKTSDEYTDTISGGHQVGPGGTYRGHIVDSQPASGGNSTSAILAEVCHVITNLDVTGNGYYPVYVDLPRHGNYCGYHSAGTCGGVHVQFSFFWKLDGDPGCDPEDTSGLHSQGLAALANVSAHEISEARTDPATPGAWYDVNGAENGDKCAWTFGAPLVALSNGVQWKLQGEWSNAAFLAGTGYPNASGQKGCLSGL